MEFKCAYDIMLCSLTKTQRSVIKYSMLKSTVDFFTTLIRGRICVSTISWGISLLKPMSLHDECFLGKGKNDLLGQA